MVVQASTVSISLVVSSLWSLSEGRPSGEKGQVSGGSRVSFQTESTTVRHTRQAPGQGHLAFCRGRWRDVQPTRQGAVGLTGKPWRGGRKQGQGSVAATTTASGAAPARLRGRGLAGRVGTLAALLTQRALARRRGDAAGHDVMLATGHQPPWAAA